ncbi:hypothetical protein [Streptomyces sp. STR69]|uniref:hypothetical protein n=1 Tax=Streptomyces sp. STR69 TaxID=1796942 RepID=UPI0021C5B658|nr:hypothetical protein [Streptomyces sp. STR69]
MLTFAKGPTAREQRLKAENRALRSQLSALTDRLADLQNANEGAYRELSSATGGPRFDPQQPFPADPPRRLGQLPRLWPSRRES